MTITYLTSTASTTLDSTGQGIAVVRPDTGQYWYPRMVRVSTVSQQGPFPYCAVYQGAPTVLDPTSLIDDTFTGNIDVSTIIAGTRTQFGQAISARWQFGNPGDTAIITVYGIVSDSPVLDNTSIVETPGTHFTGRANSNVSLIPLQSGTILVNDVLTFPTVYVGNQPYLLLSLSSPLNPSTAACDVHLQWLDERGNFNADIEDFFVVMGYAGALQMMIKPKLPRLRVILASNLARSFPYRISLVAAQGSPTYTGNKILVENIGTAITTAQTLEPQFNYVGTVNVTCSFVTAPATWSIVAKTFDKNGNFMDNVFVADQSTGAARGTLYLPSPRHRWIVTGDGTARNYNLIATGNPYQGA